MLSSINSSAINATSNLANITASDTNTATNASIGNIDNATFQTLNLLALILQLLQQIQSITTDTSGKADANVSVDGEADANANPSANANVSVDGEADANANPSANANVSVDGEADADTSVNAATAPASLQAAFSGIAGADNLIQQGELEAMVQRFAGDETVTLEEFTAYSAAIGLAPETAPALFNALADENGEVPTEGVIGLVRTTLDTANSDIGRFDEVTLEQHANFVNTLDTLATPLAQDREASKEVQTAFNNIAGADGSMLPSELDGVIMQFAGEDQMFTADEFAAFSTAIGLPAIPGATLFQSLTNEDGLTPAQQIIGLGHGAVDLANADIGRADPMNLSQYNNFITALTEFATHNDSGDTNEGIEAKAS